MPNFNFQADVNAKVFRMSLMRLVHSAKSLTDEELAKRFNTTIINYFVDTKTLAPDELMDRFGFKSEEAIKLFLNDPEVSSELRHRVQIPALRLPNQLEERFQLAYKNALESRKISFNYDTKALVGLFDIFELIKSLSDDDIKILENYLPPYSLSYFNNATLNEVRDDLCKMGLLDFELKYEGCFSGAVDNFVKPLLDGERLYKAIDEMQTPTLASGVIAAPTGKDGKKEVPVNYKEQLNKIKDVDSVETKNDLKMP